MDDPKTPAGLPPEVAQMIPQIKIGKVLVHTMPEGYHANAETTKRIIEYLESKFGEGYKAVVIPHGTTLIELPEVVTITDQISSIRALIEQCARSLVELAEQQHRIAEHVLRLTLEDDDPDPDPEDIPETDLDGNAGGREREPGQSLG